MGVGLWLMAAIVVADWLAVSPPSLARIAGILGGLCWIGRAILDDGNGPTSVIDGLHYGGLALLVIALLGIGGGLVSGLMALRVVVAICLVALAAAVLSFLHEQYADRSVDGDPGRADGRLLRRRPPGAPQQYRRGPGATPAPLTGHARRLSGGRGTGNAPDHLGVGVLGETVLPTDSCRRWAWTSCSDWP